MERFPVKRSQARRDLNESSPTVPEKRRFVVLEHRNHDGVHWDLMIETEPNGLLRTWAIDQEIIRDQVLTARALPDHRRSYLDYEGPISGERGEVKRWDEGTCLVLARDEAEVLLTFRGSQLDGSVSLRRIVGEPDSGSSWLFRFGKLS